MRIVGIQKTTLLDYPQHIAATLFLGGCNLQCPFCHNIEIAKNPNSFKEITLNEVMEFLADKVGKLQGVCITGGEPLINDDTGDLIKKIKDLGYLVKLDTNGFYPKKLYDIINAGLIDMVAMDIKSGETNYAKVCGIEDKNFNIDTIKESINIILNSNIEYEFRTTCVKGLHQKDDFYEIANLIDGAGNYYLQNYKAADFMKDLPFSSFSKNELIVFMDIVKPFVKNISLRGID